MTYACFNVTRNAGIARIMHMLYRSKTYTWKDVILVKRSMIRGVLCPRHHLSSPKLQTCLKTQSDTFFKPPAHLASSDYIFPHPPTVLLIYLLPIFP